MIFQDVYLDQHLSLSKLYELLKERTPDQSISHKEVPVFPEHRNFFYSIPYMYWYLIVDDGEVVGSVYLTKQREIGIFIFKEYFKKGYALQAINKIIEMHPGKFLANINPKNEASIKLFEKLGGKLIQHTYEVKL